MGHFGMSLMRRNQTWGDSLEVLQPKPFDSRNPPMKNIHFHPVCCQRQSTG